MNQITIIGYMGQDARTSTVGDKTVINFTVGVNDDYKQGDTWMKRTIWYGVSFWKERKVDDLKKGTLVTVQGTPRLHSYRDAQGVEKFNIQITATTIQRLSKLDEGNSNQPSSTPASYNPPVNSNTGNDVADDLPF